MPELTAPSRPANSRSAAALHRALEGRSVSRDDAISLMLEVPLAPLLAAAGAVRDRLKGRIVSYSRKVFIPLTHLCRDYCGYCTFRADPEAAVPAYMSPDEVLAVAEAGCRAGCKEALFSLGDQPELVFLEAKKALNTLGYARTLEYLAAMCEMVLEKTGLLPHSNPGVMAAEDLSRLRESNVSVGLMLETVSSRLLRLGEAHWKAPDKVPAVRLRTIENAGKLRMAFTTGLLIGIGETPEERVDALLAIRDLHEKYGHIQEVIIQPFRSKPATRMDFAAEPTHQDLQRTIAVARLVLGGEINLQSPPNLLSRDYPELLKAGINDWGGISPVTKDFINPEAAWPQIASLAARTADAGFVLRERLAIYPEFLRAKLREPEFLREKVSRRSEFLNPRLEPHLRRLEGPNGYAAGDSGQRTSAPANLGGRSFSSDLKSVAPAALAAEESAPARANPVCDMMTSMNPERRQASEVERLEVRQITWEQALSGAGVPVARALEKIMAGGELGFDEGLLLANVDGPDLVALVKVADELRRRVVGDHITYVVNRNLNFTNVCIVGCAFCGFGRNADAPDAYFHSTETLVAKAVEAVEQRGATEVCIQGGLPRDFDGNYYAALLRAIKARLPQLHIHAYSPMEITYGVEKTRLPLREFLLSLKEAGLNSIPGTAAEILDDEVRKSLSPNKLKVKQWIEVIRTAHSLGIPTTSTMMYGHTESPEHWVRHLLLLRDIQKDTGGFTEFVPLGFIHTQTKLFLSGRARAGHGQHEDLIVHALARVLLHGQIRNIQVSWVKLGFLDSLRCLEAGANDFGGTLMEESISKAAGANWGEYVAPGEFRALIRSIGRIPAERATSYKLLNIFEQPDADERLPVERMQPQMPPLAILNPAADSHQHAPISATGY